ncbi:MAG: hypothetical protein HY053_09310 [Proteobacteria bacterium]|nr:hypothetical protein [Pseudomonadota bacterium]
MTTVDKITIGLMTVGFAGAAIGTGAYIVEQFKKTYRDVMGFNPAREKIQSKVPSGPKLATLDS